MNLYFDGLAVGIIVIGAAAAYANVRMGLMRTGRRRVLRFINAAACSITALFYAIDLFGPLDPGLQAATLMRPVVFLFVCLFLSNVIVNWPVNGNGK